MYHAIDALGDPKWLNLWSLSESLLRPDEKLVAVKYFSAFQTKRPDAYARHRSYVKALKFSGVSVQMGNFKFKDMECRRCHTQWKQPEEKETDVHIAITMVSDAFLGNFERCILISADSDLVPPKSLIKAQYPEKEFFVVAPPGRFGSARALKPNMEITKGRLKKHLFDLDIKDQSSNVVISAPREYR